MSVYVNFTDSTEEEIIAFFVSLQDPEVYQYPGVVDVDDPRWKVLFAAQPEFIQGHMPTPE